MLIDVSEIRKKYGEREILRGISFQLTAGKILALVGPSGGGKSTLLRCMVGLESFDSGSVRIADALLQSGSAPHRAPALSKLYARAGLVFQSWNLFPHMSALENVCEAPIHVKKMAPHDAKNRARTLLTKVGLGHREDAMPRDMSGGEQQRCAIARALAMEPSVLFMDEPTSALDPQRSLGLVGLLQELRERENLTVIVVTHEMRFAEKLADRVLVLYEGQVIEDGPPARVFGAPSDPRIRDFLGHSDSL
jgi:polar amino acid transport system ATP-binding protein